jgi:site-specific DNA recombinase
MRGSLGGLWNGPDCKQPSRCLRRGTANTLIVVKLDRLSRSLRDVCTLVEDYFGNERYHLLSLCGMANTHSAAGRMVLMNLANYAQFEREMISERTRDALRHMKSQGVRLGPLLTDTRSATKWMRTDAGSWFRFLTNRK